ncbi:hypothetical protein [Sinomicrobium sp. M5D2P17]
MRTWINSLCSFILLFALMGCNSEKTKEFVWEKEIAQLTGKNLDKWLRQAPFSNELVQTDANKLVFTNAEQVFPFMARYKNAVGELHKTYNDPDNPIYQKKTVLYQDPQWGDLFVNATLLYDDQEVFLDRSYSTSGNVILGGADAAMDIHHATLSETAVFARTSDYKTGVYWARISDKDYLLGFYQKDRLIFETVIPLRATDTLATLSKLNAVNEKLGLHIAEWKDATVQQLKPANTKETFWKDPFVGIYMDKSSTLNKVHLKMRDTPFQQAQKIVKGGYYFSYDTPKGRVTLFTVLKGTDQDRIGFDEEHQQLNSYKRQGQVVYYKEEQVKGRIKGVAKTYFGQDQYLELNFEYPQTDQEAREYIHGVLKNIMIFRYL